MMILRPCDPAASASSHSGAMPHGFCFHSSSGCTSLPFSLPFLRWGLHLSPPSLPSPSPNWCPHQYAPNITHCHSIYPKEQVQFLSLPCSKTLSSSHRPPHSWTRHGGLSTRWSPTSAFPNSPSSSPLYIFSWHILPSTLSSWQFKLPSCFHICLSESYSHLFKGYPSWKFFWLQIHRPLPTSTHQICSHPPLNPQSTLPFSKDAIPCPVCKLVVNLA